MPLISCCCNWKETGAHRIDVGWWFSTSSDSSLPPPAWKNNAFYLRQISDLNKEIPEVIKVFFKIKEIWQVKKGKALLVNMVKVLISRLVLVKYSIERSTSIPTMRNSWEHCLVACPCLPLPPYSKGHKLPLSWLLCCPPCLCCWLLSG